MLTLTAQVFVTNDNESWHTQYSLGSDLLKFQCASGLTEPVNVQTFPVAGDGDPLKVALDDIIHALKGEPVAVNTLNHHLYFEPVAATRGNILSLWLADGRMESLDLRLEVALPKGTEVALAAPIDGRAFHFISIGDEITFLVHNNQNKL